MSAAILNLETFQRTVATHLAAAAARIPATVPNDVFDPAVQPMMQELHALDEFLYGLGRDECAQQDREYARESVVRAKALQPTLERSVVRLDECVQRMVESIGADPDGWRVGGMFADRVVEAFVHFLDAVPAGAFAADRMVPENFPSHRDATVQAIICLMRERKGGPR